jgi:DNA-directed RNA polymerase specialized sigma subunit
VELEREQNQLKYYISLLEERQALVIQLSYVQRVPQDKAAAELGVSIRTVQSLKGQAVTALADMYRLASEVH